MKLAAVGSNCVDFYSNIENGKAYPGGGPVNMAVYTVRLGGEASYTGPVGDDVYGKIMQEAIAAKGVDTSHLHVKPGKTAVSQVELLEGERVFGDYEEGVLEDYTLSEEDMDFIQTHDMVVCDLWGKVEGQFRALKARGIPTAFDCATRPEDEASRIAMPYTDYLFFSSDDGDTPALRDQMKGYHSRGPKLVIALLGLLCLLLLWFGIPRVSWTYYASGFYSAFTVLGMFLFADRKTKHELKKRFHF